MPGLVQRNAQFGNGCQILPSMSGSVSADGIWSRHRGDVTFDQLQKFWSELSPQTRQQLLRIDKHTLFEQARKNLYCSRCNGLLLEGFSQIVMYGRSLQQEGSQDEIQDPSVHPWGGLAATRDGILTLLDCFLNGNSLKLLQNVFDSSRARERERELLYPDACGGEGRGWISQGVATYGRGHGSRETCALHTARLSCDTLVDFWSALGDETRQSLLQMKEEDFIERLMYRFDSKRFCRDCRKNVIREFKELKELKRMRREPRCTSWFCAADTAFQYEVSDNAVLADWHQSFADTVGSYHHFELAVGTGEGKSDILEFKDVGMSESVEEKGLELGGLSSCFITLRAWKLDGRCTELSVKACALKGRPCVHRRLIVGDGFVTITRGESIRSFFEHAEEAEEEEDDDSMDKDVNDLDGDGSRPQKHAKSPELAREFLLDAATVIFKDQVEKAFREGTARQNAHSIFVCLALKLLEERVHVACKEIITLEKQIKLLEEEEKEKQEEEERKERKRTKEREKKLRRKERLKGKDKKCAESKPLSCNSDPSGKEMSLNGPDEPYNSSSISGDSVSETGENGGSFTSLDEQPSEFMDLKVNTSEGNCLHHHPYNVDGDFIVRDGNGSYMTELSKYSRRKLRFRKDFITDPASKWCDRRNICVGQESNFQVHSSETKYHGYGTATSRCFNGLQKHPRNSALKFDTRNCGPKFAEKFHCSNNRTRDWSDFHSCSCDQHNIYRPKDGLRYSVLRSDRDIKNDGKSDATSDIYSKPNNGCYGYNKGTISRVRHTVPLSKREILHARKVWEPLDLRKKNTKGDLEPDYSQASCNGGDNNSEKLESICQSFDDNCNSEISISLGKVDGSTNHQDVGNEVPSGNSYTLSREDGFQDGLCSNISPDPAETSSTPDSCSSCLSEGDSTAGSSGVPSAESLYNSDSEDTSQHSEGREASTYTENPSHKCQDAGIDEKVIAKGDESLQNDTTASDKGVFRKDITLENGHNPENGISKVDVGSEQACAMPVHNKNLQLPVLPAHSTMGYYHHNPAAWAAGPANGLMSYPHMNRYFFTGPFGYGIPANQSSHFCVQYSPTLQPMSDSMVNVHHLPTYQTGNKASPVVLEEPRKARIPGKKQEAKCLTATMVSEDPPKRTLPSNLVPQRSTKPQHDVNPSKSVGRSSNFSLFHFGGPVAVPSGDLRNQDQLLKSTGKVVKTDCSSAIKETSVEEYSLFAASNGPRFPFF